MIAIGPAWERPKKAADDEPAASSTLNTSSICSSMGGSTGARSESPVPRASIAISRENDDRRPRKRAKVGSSH